MTIHERVQQSLGQNEDFLCAVATVGTDGWPHVRYMRGVIDAQLVIRCPTFIDTQKVRDIRHRPVVSVTCGDTDSGRPGTYFQITARATVTQDPEDRKKAWTPRLSNWFRGPEDPGFAVIRMEPARIVALPIGGGAPPEVWEAGG